MLKSVLTACIASAFLLGCGNQLSPEIEKMADLDRDLERIKGASYYECLKKDIITHLNSDLNLTDREKEAIKFEGRGNTELLIIKNEVQTRINKIIADRFVHSTCVKNWK